MTFLGGLFIAFFFSRKARKGRDRVFREHVVSCCRREAPLLCLEADAHTNDTATFSSEISQVPGGLEEAFRRKAPGCKQKPQRAPRSSPSTPQGRQRERERERERETERERERGWERSRERERELFIHIYIYTHIYPVQSKTGPRFGGFCVKNWSKSCAKKRSKLFALFSPHFLSVLGARLKTHIVSICAKIVFFVCKIVGMSKMRFSKRK